MMTKNEEVIFSSFFCKILNPGKENMGKNERGSSFSGLRLRKKKKRALGTGDVLSMSYFRIRYLT